MCPYKQSCVQYNTIGLCEKQTKIVQKRSHKSVNHKNRTVGFVSELDSQVEIRLNPVVVVPELKAHWIERLSANNNLSLFLTQINCITSRISHQSYVLILLCCFWNPGYFHLLLKYIKIAKNLICHNLLVLTCMTQNNIFLKNIFVQTMQNNIGCHFSHFSELLFRKRM